MEANNIQMMLLGYLERLAECHEILGDNPTRVSQHDTIVKTAATECINGMAACHPGTVSGHSSTPGVTIHGASIPARWKASGTRRMTWLELSRIQSQPHGLPGQGQSHSFC